MKIKHAALVGMGLVAGCSSPIVSNNKVHEFTPEQLAKVPPVSTPHAPPPSARIVSIDAYKEALARRIHAASAGKVYPGQPQALLRSVIVMRFSVDAEGKLLRSEFVRTNHDKAAEATAMASLRDASPFPQPAPAMLARGKLELSETWLFNNDGRFQLRTIAQPQKTDL